MTARKLTRQDLRDAAEKFKNWGRWGPADEIGTLNYTQPEDIVAAARLVRKGKVISLALNFDQNGPQGAKSKYPSLGRINPVHTMLRTGTDAYSGVLDHRGIRAADDMVVMPLQCGTQWDGLGHIFYENSMWNGYDCREVTSFGAQKCGIEKTKSRMVGRGVFLDVPRALGMDVLPDGHGITSSELDKAAKFHNVEVRRGDYVIVRTGQMGAKVAPGSWDGDPGGDAPGFSFETLDWIHRRQIAAIAADTWGCEVRPNETEAGINQPWHWITIPIMGLTMGEIFYLAELATDCAADDEHELVDVVRRAVRGELGEVEDLAHRQAHDRDRDPVPGLVDARLGLVRPHLAAPGVGCDRGNLPAVDPLERLEREPRRIAARIAVPAAGGELRLHLPGAHDDVVAAPYFYIMKFCSFIQFGARDPMPIGQDVHAERPGHVEEHPSPDHPALRLLDAAFLRAEGSHLAAVVAVPHRVLVEDVAQAVPLRAALQRHHHHVVGGADAAMVEHAGVGVGAGSQQRVHRVDAAERRVLALRALRAVLVEVERERDDLALAHQARRGDDVLGLRVVEREIGRA